MQKKGKIIFSDDLIKLLPKTQYMIMREIPEAYADEINRMNEIVGKIPQLNETEGNEVHPLSLHYFVGGCDWYIVEWDRQDRFFGYAILNGDYENSEWGYISCAEILDLEFPKKFLLVNLDLHCHYATVEEALYAKNKEHFWWFAPENLSPKKQKEDRKMTDEEFVTEELRRLHTAVHELKAEREKIYQAGFYDGECYYAGREIPGALPECSFYFHHSWSPKEEE